jgi:hypothetical protein
MLRYTYVGNVNQNVKVAILSLIVKVSEKTVYPGNGKKIIVIDVSTIVQQPSL